MNSNIHKAATPKKIDLISIRLLVGIGLLATTQFFLWFFKPEHIGNKILFYTLAFIFLFKLISYLIEWFYYASIKVPEPKILKRDWTVDMLTTYVPGEPYDMIIKTLEAMVAVKYPHNTILCDEGDDPYLKKVCKELGVIHVYRGKDKTGAKAGNINYALRNVAKGEICVILDPDHIPIPEFLDRTLPYFDDDKIGYVQCVQGYYNRNESFVAKGAAEQTYMFYGPLMMGMFRHGTAQAIGANCTFRRAALDSIGGHAFGLCEDMHTSMQLHAKKWKSIYLPEMLTKGLVPATLSAYYKQQIKWSRGSFDLLFNVVPKLFWKWNWRQRLHYVFAPTYFLNGLVVMLSLFVPIISLITSSVPLEIDIMELLLFASPMLISMLFIKQYMQRFLMEEHERGFHLLGGILKVGAWWVFLTGFIYALVGKKVPYIPTPKGDELKNEWKLCIPNLIMIALSFLAIIYGLSLDWTPYSWFMASFAIFNIIFLATATLIALQRSVERFMTKNFNWIHPFRLVWYVVRHQYFYNAFRKPLAIIGSISYSSIMIILLNFIPISEFYKSIKEQDEISVFGPKLVDVSFNENYAAELPTNFNQLISGTLDQADTNLYKQTTQFLNIAKEQSAMPYLTWKLDSAISTEKLSSLASAIREHHDPVAFRLEVPRDTSFGEYISQQKLFIDNWLNAMHVFEQEAVANLSWIWKAGPDTTSLNLYPGKYFVDMVEWSIEENGGSTNPCALSKWFDKPVLIKGDYPVNPSCLSKVNGYGFVSVNENTLNQLWASKNYEPAEKNPVDTVKIDIKISESFFPDNLYIKGLAYNPEHDWRDGHCPLTNVQLDRDFEKITAMGVNTIRRYGHTVYDYNILRKAEQHNLNVMYGFWFDPKVDYLNNKKRVAELKDEVIHYVEKYKDYPSILCWVIGNETWGQLKHHFEQPYLTEVRKAYILMIEELAAEIRALDPNRKILTALESSRDLGAALYQFNEWAPNIDAIAINAYYHQEMKLIRGLSDRWNPNRPYLISEFGPLGYWNRDYTYMNGDRVLEQSSFEKARMYVESWEKYVAPNKEANLGGVAYCWRDRMEGTATWFGITDYEGRLKPTYYALKNVWTGSQDTFPISDAFLADITNFLTDPEHKVFKVVSQDNQNLYCNVEWTIRANEFLLEEDKIGINYRDIGWIRYKMKEEVRQHLTNYAHPEKKGRVFRIPIEKAEDERRVYIYISDKEGHVVTTSLPF